MAVLDLNAGYHFFADDIPIAVLHGRESLKDIFLSNVGHKELLGYEGFFGWIAVRGRITLATLWFYKAALDL
jgi:hypothetical protein